MDKRAAGQYLDRIFAGKTGYVAVAHKDPHNPRDWQERQFEWPADKSKLLHWAETHQDGNVFICPALRKDSYARKKGDMQSSRWLWADVDWQNIPANKQAHVKARIEELSSFTVFSGTGDNVHVYVELKESVPHPEWIKLNTGLRDYLYADNKQADNSLLRLPGTTNWKNEAGSRVKQATENAVTVAPGTLMKRRAFRDAKVPVEAEATEWSYVEVEGLSRRLTRQLNMTADEAKGRYGARNTAVFAMVKELHKRGLGVDEIHSLMDQFPPALDKAADENGYDRHHDIDRCLARIRQIEDAIPPDLTDDEAQQVIDGVEIMEEATDEDMQEELLREVRQLAEKIRIRREADRMARTLEAERTWIEPPPTVTQSLSDALKNPPEPEPFLIHGLAPARGNVVLTAQFKAGKTDLLMGSLARALCDGVPFLGEFAVEVPEGGIKVGHWNIEMDHTFLVDQYIRPSGYENTDNLIIASLRGYRINLVSEIGRRWAVEWLKTNEIKVWTIDSIAQLARMCGISENSNEEMAQMFGAIDEIKTEAGVDACFLIAHTGRAEQEVGKERARAATIIDDWPDFRWVMTVDSSDIRYLQVQGRGEGLSPTSLDYDKENHRYSYGGQTRGTVVSYGWVQEVTRIVNMFPKGITEASLWAKMKEVRPIAKSSAVEYMVEADSSGFIVRKRGETGGRGGRKPWMHFPLEKPDEGDRTRKATPGVVDLSDVNVRRRR